MAQHTADKAQRSVRVTLANIAIIAMSVGLVATMSSVLFDWLTDPGRPLRFDKFEVAGTAPVGGTVDVTIFGERFYPCTGTFTRWFVDPKQGFSYPVGPFFAGRTSREMGPFEFTFALRVPTQAPPGTYKVTTAATYECEHGNELMAYPEIPAFTVVIE